MTEPNILLIDDETVLLESLSSFVQSLGFQATSASTGEEGLRLARTAVSKPDVIVLDLNLPDKSGYEVAQELRNHEETKKIPVVMLTCEDTQERKLEGLRSGVSEYITKPFDLDELELRLRFWLEQRSAQSQLSTEIRIGDAVLNLSSQILSNDTQQVSLTSTELRLLEAFRKNPSRPVSKAELMNSIWSDKQVTPKNIDRMVSLLRKKTEQFGVKVLTIYGRGYQLVTPEEKAS